MVNFSQAPTVTRLAISGWLPPPSALTNLPLACDRNATCPFPTSICSNSSQAPDRVPVGDQRLRAARIRCDEKEVGVGQETGDARRGRDVELLPGADRRTAGDERGTAGGVRRDELAVGIGLPLARLPSTGFGALMVNFSQSPTVSRLAMSAALPAASALTNLPLARDLNATNPPPASTLSYCSQPPAPIRLARSDCAPPASAVTYRSLASESRLTGVVSGVVPAMLSSLSGELVPALCRVPVTAPPTMSARTWAGARVGLADSSNAAAPATCGAAISSTDQHLHWCRLQTTRRRCRCRGRRPRRTNRCWRRGPGSRSRRSRR